MLEKKRLKGSCRGCLLAFLMLVGASMTTWAQSEDAIFIKTGEQEQIISINEIKEVTFQDAEMTVIKNDNTEISFSGEWSISFGVSDQNGLQEVKISLTDDPVEVFNLEGVKVASASSLSECDYNVLPAGVYIIKCNDKCLKIKKR